MKKIFAICVLCITFVQLSLAQASRVIGPAEKKITDSICNALSKRDISKITNKQEAVALYTSCVMEHADLLQELADELKVDVNDQAAMQKVGMNIAFNLMKDKCANFIKLSTYFAEQKATEVLNNYSTGVLKRIDNKGFNYIVITEKGAEKSFLWLRQFAGSEKFTSGLGTNVGKHVKVEWQEIEVYLPLAKGYYKVKEITGITLM
ncbi:hypothetical protein BDD43_5695 [Mucilaginibacter gracilis]|uniref:Gluconate 2-dehydrogenase subunit 3-like protein n=1 Tax=Mucilaginibacter gracilis TaxID=423350 RepID=A0A495JAJ5_9SPHI|nr:hypothetical protein [Mucilaginibacter gracilis]RKR85424.1 hypothetical protein BDD43_5695 [Mucilaginibacter gracilis]